MSDMPTRQECIAAAGRAFAAGRARRDALTPRQAAEEAFVPGGPSVEEIEELIREQRRQARERPHRDAPEPTG